MRRLKDYKMLIIFVSVLIAISLTVFTTKKIVKNKQTKDNQSVATVTEIVEDSNEVSEISIEDENLEDVDPEDTSWDEEAEETKLDEKEEKKAKENGTSQYYIKINYTANVVTIYSKDAEGNYTVPVKALVCSTGTATPTSGVYKMSNKYRWHMLNGGVYGQYCTRITGHILFHSVPYATNSPDSLKYTAYDKLGTKASAGCIRLTVQDAMWIYNNCASGTYVEFYSSSNPGPLGKPSAQKISSNVDCRNWDPTDPDSRNPWHGYVEPKKTEVVQEVKQQEIKNTTEEKKNDDNNNQNENTENTNTQTNIDENQNSNTNIDTNTNTNSSTNQITENNVINNNTENDTITQNQNQSNTLSNETV